MKINKPVIWIFILMIIAAALYRLIPNRPAGFAPQMAMALLGGALIKDKKWAFALPLFSLFISDSLFELMYTAGLTEIRGFYIGQWTVYCCFALITVFGFLMKRINFKKVFLFSVSGSAIFFLITNFMVWIVREGFQRPLTFNGLMLCYGDALAFYRDYGLVNGFALNFLLGDLTWTAVLFGAYYLVTKFSTAADKKLA